MKAVVIEHFGGADAVRVADVPEPVPAPGEVLVEMRYASVNPADWKLREGWLRAAHEPRFPYVLGFDGAGVIAGTGERVAVKSAVGRGGHGAMAERIALPAHLVAPLPAWVDFVEAATLPCAGITAWEMTFEQGEVREGQAVLVNGGAGGTGSLCVQLACMAGADVTATAGPANQAYLRQLGAHAIDYRAGPVAGTYDLILDTVGQGSLADPLGLLHDGGRMITVATLVEGESRPSAAEAKRRGIAIITASSSREREGDQLRALVAALGRGEVRAAATDIRPAAQAAAAIERVKQGHVRGKLVLDLGEWG